jgi:hypothetical protein
MLRRQHGNLLSALRYSYSIVIRHPLPERRGDQKALLFGLLAALAGVKAHRSRADANDPTLIELADLTVA